MAVEARKCPGCGAAVAADAPGGLCPRCLMKAGLESQAGSGSEAGASGPTAHVSAGSFGMKESGFAGPGRDSGGGGSSGAGFVPPTPAELSGLVPNLEIIEVLGQGGMGVVYKARQPGLDRLVALKVLPPAVGGDPAFAERFAREARALARLSHPSIVGIFDFGKAGGLYYFVMEYVDGVNIRQMIRAGRLSPREALAITPQICDALQYAHDEGVVHRDIKPENILIDRKGRVKIADFGLAKLLGREKPDWTLTGPRHVMGTPHYMAPEQLEKPLEVDHRADIYSLGVVIYEMLTGELPLGRFALPSQKVQVDVRLDDVVLKTLEKDPGRRYQHASEVKTAFESASTGAQPAVSRMPAAAGGARRGSRWLLWVVLIGAVGMVILLPIASVAVYWLVAAPAPPSREGGAGAVLGKSLDLDAALGKILDPQLSYDDKEKVWIDVLQARLIDPAIERLEKRIEEGPPSAEVHFQLGNACIKKLVTVATGEQPDWGRRADLAFDEALKLDPEHFPARLSKAVSLTFWPDFLGKKPEAIRQLDILIEKMEQKPVQSGFAQPYIILGNLHLQQGNAAKAMEVWKRGAERFPGNQELADKIREQDSRE